MWEFLVLTHTGSEYKGGGMEGAAAVARPGAQPDKPVETG